MHTRFLELKCFECSVLYEYNTEFFFCFAREVEISYELHYLNHTFNGLCCDNNNCNNQYYIASKICHLLFFLFSFLENEKFTVPILFTQTTRLLMKVNRNHSKFAARSKMTFSSFNRRDLCILL